jgi:hypothetical protein
MKRTGFAPRIKPLASILRTASLPAIKPRKCAVCPEKFQPQRPMQRVCGHVCAAEDAKRKREKQARKELVEGRLALKSRSAWLADAQTVFNSFIRTRDAHLPCISCGRFHTGSYDAGHYRSVGSMPALRFDEDNCHRQCVPCNQHKSGNVVEYRIGLVARIGVKRVAQLEGPQAPAKYTIEDAKAIKAEYKAKLKQLQADIKGAPSA